MLKLLTICTLVSTVFAASNAADAQNNELYSRGPGACNTALQITTDLPATAVLATNTIVLTFGSTTEFITDSGVPRLNVACGSEAGATTLTNIGAGTNFDDASTQLYKWSVSGQVLSITGAAHASAEMVICVVSGLCQTTEASQTVTVTVTGGTDTVTAATPTAGETYAQAAGTVAWTSGGVLMNVAGTLALTYTPVADVADNDYVVVSARYILFGSSCACTIGSTTASAASETICARDYVAFQATGTVTAAAGISISCTEATPYSTRSSALSSGLCVAEGDTVGFNSDYASFKCASLPVTTTTSAPTASPTTSCVGGAALWAAAPATRLSPVVALVVFVVAVLVH